MNNSHMNKNCNLENHIPEPQSFEGKFFLTLMRINKQLRGYVEQDMKDMDVSPPQMWFLSRLHDAGEPKPISFFADGVFSNRSNATQMIDRLEADGLVERFKNPNDRRSTLVKLTSVGEQRLHEGRDRHERIIADLLAPLSDDEREETLIVLERVLGLLDK